mmetsp:Transcript_4000/g.7665  ORF Transcript_4000/g.7665 Transcript_4000/m.7665 type:complete len:88 (-) Transcript_4000:653-916(-)
MSKKGGTVTAAMVERRKNLEGAVERILMKETEIKLLQRMTRKNVKKGGTVTAAMVERRKNLEGAVERILMKEIKIKLLRRMIRKNAN